MTGSLKKSEMDREAGAPKRLAETWNFGRAPRLSRESVWPECRNDGHSTRRKATNLKRFFLVGLALLGWGCGTSSDQSTGVIPGTSPNLATRPASAILQPPSGLITTRFLTHDANFNDYRPTFSPDASIVVFERNTVGNKLVRLHKVSSSGGAVTLLLNDFSLGSTRPDWSAASNRIAFTGESSAGGTLWICNPDGSNLFQVAPSQFRKEVAYPHWFPDGQSLAVTDYGNSGPLSSEKGVVRKVTASAQAPLVTDLTDPTQLLAGDSAVSPNGRWLTLAAQAEVTAPYNQDTNSIFVIDLQNSKAPPMLFDAGQGRAPTWSPDGKIILFESNRASSHGQYALFAKRFSGSPQDLEGPLLQLTPDALDAQHGEFDRSGRQIVLTALQGSPANSPRGIMILDLASALENLP